MNDLLTPVEKRIAIARTWASRIEKLTNKKNGGKSEAEFCRVHNFDTASFNRNKKLRAIPSQKTVDLIESALKAERV